MELEEMKTLWDEMSGAIEKQQKLTDSLILKMTRTSFRNKVNTIFIPEIIGSAVCMAAVLLILFNFQALNNWYLLFCGLASVTILILIPALSLQSIFAIRSINISGNNLEQLILQYSKTKKHFIAIQKTSFYLGALLFLVSIPVMGKVIGNKDFFKEADLWYIFAVGFFAFYFFARWIFKKYTKAVEDAENIIRELQCE